LSPNFQGILRALRDGLGAKILGVMGREPENWRFPYLMAPAGHAPLQAVLGTVGMRIGTGPS